MFGHPYLLHLGSSHNDRRHLYQHPRQPPVAQQPCARHGHLWQDRTARHCSGLAILLLKGVFFSFNRYVRTHFLFMQGFSWRLASSRTTALLQLQLQHHPLLRVSLLGHRTEIYSHKTTVRCALLWIRSCCSRVLLNEGRCLPMSPLRNGSLSNLRKDRTLFAQAKTRNCKR